MPLRVLVILCFLLSLSAAQHRLDLNEGDVCKQEGEKTWACKALRSCPKAILDMQRKKRPQFCRFKANTPVVCCEPPDSTPHTLPQPSWYPGAGSKSKQMCKEYARYVYVMNNIDSCAVVEPLITTAKNAEPREYPHVALIGYGDKKDVEWLCGGSLISDRFVLSGAHCTYSSWKGLAKWVRLGEHNVASTQDDEQNLSQPLDLEIVERTNHPDYRSPSVYSDIALFKLGRRVEFNKYIRPICLHSADQPLDSFVIASGWGNTEWGGYQSDVLQKVNLTITPAEKCKSAFRAAIGPNLSKGIQDAIQFCAGDKITGGDTCQGDSGGPVQVPLGNPYCMYSQIGITSFGSKCGGNKPGVYTRVSHFVPWIESIVWP